jgi:polyisoprenoid-binding protein YceI
MFKMLTAIAFLGLASPGIAQDWSVDQSESYIGFETSAFGQDVIGQFPRHAISIHLDPDNLESAIINAQIEIMAGKTDSRSFDDSMLGIDGLAPNDHPFASYVSTDIRHGETGYEAHGTMTIRGIDQPLILPFTLDIENGHATADARLEILREDYGVGASDWGDAAFTVTLVLHIEARSEN